MGEPSAASDDAEFDAILVAHHAAILRFLRRVVGRDGESEDLCQETFLRAHRAWAERPPEASRRAWLYAIATNAVRNHARSERRRRVAYASVRITRREIQRHGPEDEVAAREVQLRTERAIGDLPLRQRLAFTMRKLEDLDYDAIAGCLDCSAETARAHVFQALRKLRASVLDRPMAGRRTAR
jgi:RNA polymerase sigma-70 factor, ECF subfamily